jgi:guanylate kinase
MTAGHLFVLSGPSGAGKGTILKEALTQRPDVVYSISLTTRPPRPGEEEGVHYHFVSDEEFHSRRERGEFLEWANLYGKHLSGTLRAPVDEALRSGRDVLLELDVQGAAQVKRDRPEAILIFVEPPSFEELVERLESRGTEDAAAKLRRVETAYEEVKSKSDYDHVIVNDEVGAAVGALVRILDRYRSKERTDLK